MIFRAGTMLADRQVSSLVRSAAGALSMRVLAAWAVFMLHIVLGRLLGPGGAGSFFLAFTLVTIAATVARLGMDYTIVRFVAGERHRNKSGNVAAVFRRGAVMATVGGSLVTFGVFFAAPFLSGCVFSQTGLGATLPVMAFGIVPFAVYWLSGQALQGLGHVGTGIFVSNALAAILAVVALTAWPPSMAKEAAGVWVGAAFITAAAGVALWLWRRPSIVEASVSVGYRTMLNSSLPLLGAAVLALSNSWAPILLLGVWHSSLEVGVYNAAVRTALLVSFVLAAINGVTAPRFSELFTAGDMCGLERTARCSSLLATVAAVPAAVLLVVAPELVLSLFGDGFRVGTIPLTILVVGQLANAATGSANLVLIMSGQERASRNVTAVAAGVTLVLCLALVPGWSSTGAAIAGASALIVQNTLAVHMVRARLGISPIPWLPARAV